MTLEQVPAGGAAVVDSFLTAKPSLTRLRELGLVPGTRIEVVRRAPLGDPMEIRLRQSHLAVRNSDAACIGVRLAE
jgi:ferrous iron transport protein A